MLIGPVDTTEQVAVVAEIGNNHEGDFDVAIELTRAAAAAGAHAVKFQAIDPPRLVRPSETARLEQLGRFQLTPEQFRLLHDEAHGLGIGFLCTPFDIDAVGWLAPLVDAFKIASADNDFTALIAAAADTGRPVIVSAGMTGLDGMLAARDIVTGRGAEFAALHCVSAYPTEPQDAALATIPALAAALDATVGYSDHTLGIDACVLAVALGARILEKHFTLRHDYSDFRDHQLSADPAELAELVRRVTDAQTLIGTTRGGVLTAEEPVSAAARRSIVAARDLPAGHVIAAEDLTWLRPGDGLSPGREGELLGRALQRAVTHGETLLPDDVSDRG